MAPRTTRWDTTDHLRTHEERAAYLEAALEENDPAFFQHALGLVARAQGIQDVAAKSSTTRAGLYKALSSEGNPEFATVYRVIHALGYRIALVSSMKPVRPRKTAASKRAPPKATPARKKPARTAV